MKRHVDLVYIVVQPNYLIPTISNPPALRPAIRTVGPFTSLPSNLTVEAVGISRVNKQGRRKETPLQTRIPQPIRAAAERGGGKALHLAGKQARVKKSGTLIFRQRSLSRLGKDDRNSELLQKHQRRSKSVFPRFTQEQEHPL